MKRFFWKAIPCGRKGTKAPDVLLVLEGAFKELSPDVCKNCRKLWEFTELGSAVHAARVMAVVPVRQCSHPSPLCLCIHWHRKVAKGLLQNAFVYSEHGKSAVWSDYIVTVPIKLQRVHFPITLWFRCWNNMKRARQSWLLAVTWHQQGSYWQDLFNVLAVTS